jgi:hypothetical protein
MSKYADAKQNSPIPSVTNRRERKFFNRGKNRIGGKVKLKGAFKTPANAAIFLPE